MREVGVFLASPDDVLPEREAAVLRRYGKGLEP